MKDRSTTDIIMTLVAIIIICGIASCGKVNAARGCLEREEAKRTWPTKTLGIDDDGCWTYMRRGINPSPKAPVIDVPYSCTPRQAEEGECLPLLLDDKHSAVSVETAAGLDLLQRWPTSIEMKMTPYEPFVEPEPMMTAKNMWAAVFSVVLFCAVLEVLFGGKVIRQKTEARPWLDR